MESERNKNKYTIIMIIILVILVIALLGIGYYKFLGGKDNTSTSEINLKNETNTKNDNTKAEDDKNNDKVTQDDKSNEKESEDSKSNDKEDKNDDYVKTRTCTGIYSGNAKFYGNAQGTFTIELIKDGTYELKRADEGYDEATVLSFGTYTIIDNALLLTTTPELCGPNSDCSPKYTMFLDISKDCSTISEGYGSYFFDPDFTLKKQK